MRQLTVSVKGKILGEEETFYADITDRIQSLNFGTSAFGGYNDATIMITMSGAEASEWIQNGLCRDVTIYGPSLEVVWNGFINQIQVTLSGRNTTVGPVTDIGNAVVSQYAPIDTALTVPAIGSTTTSAWGNDTASQSRYGIWQKVMTAGARDPDEVDDLVNRWLAQTAYPPTTHLLSSSGTTVQIMLVCAGYYRALTATVYENLSNALVDASDKIEDILDNDINSIFSSANADITQNIFTVSEYDATKRTLLDAIQSVVALGGPSANRWLFGVYAGRKAIYQEAPSEVEYLFYQADQTPGIFTETYAHVDPWNVLPGKWLFDPDFLVGRVPAGTPSRQDPRMLFIEQVRYTTPMTLVINGAPLDMLSQKLAQVTMTGGFT